MASHGSLVSIFAPHSRFYEGPFGRMFRNLPAWEPDGATEAERIAFIEAIANRMVDPAPPAAALDNPSIPAGYTYFGQFVDHDITFDPTSTLERANDPERIHNFRTPRFDLDNMYGRGPAAQPYLYESKTDPRTKKFLIGTNAENGAREHDLPRNLDASDDGYPPPPPNKPPKQVDMFTRRRRALIGDPRNDENIIVAQMHLTMLKLHNAFIDRHGKTFEEAQRLTRWHYQWVVIHDFLKRLCGRDLVNEILQADENGTPLGLCPGKPKFCFYKYEDQPFIPVEFAVAAYRLGHSMVRGAYHLNERLRDIRVNQLQKPRGGVLDIFGGLPEDNLDGNRLLPGFWTIAWSRYVDHNSAPGALQLSRKIDTKVVRQLFTLPGIGPVNPNSLPMRNLMRGWRMGLPSGQAVARRMGIPHAQFIPGNDPLWFYILQEAENAGGERLGPVGARIVAEVFIGLLAGDPSSFYSVDPTWVPSLPNQGGGFQLRDLFINADAPMSEDEANRVMDGQPIR